MLPKNPIEFSSFPKKMKSPSKAMLATLLVILSTLFISQIKAQDKDELAIRKILASQTEQWNKGNIAAFMKGYWKSDSLLFVGKSGANFGYQKTLDNYYKGYPDTAAMGKLSFDLIQFRRLSPDYFFVLGKWHLKRSIGDVGGAYTLLFRKIKGEWVIVVDHSS